MKNRSKIQILSLIVFFSILATACTNEDTTPLDQTITGIAQTTPDWSLFVQALERTELTTTLQASGSYTVFVPTNAAFAAFLATTPYATINDVPKAALTEILLNHVISSAVKSTNLTTGYIKTLAKGTASPTNTLSMYVNTASNRVQLNGISTVITADIMASNGIIHTVDKVIGLPTIVTHATANPDFTSLVGALTGAGQPNFVNILSAIGPFTVFAPTNDAFISLNTELAPGGIAGVSAANLTKVLQYHVVSGNVPSASLTEGQVVPTLQTPQTFTVQLTGGAKIKDGSNRIATLLATDVQCSNGVIHVLNKVLLPSF